MLSSTLLPACHMIIDGCRLDSMMKVLVTELNFAETRSYFMCCTDDRKLCNVAMFKSYLHALKYIHKGI